MNTGNEQMRVLEKLADIFKNVTLLRVEIKLYHKINSPIKYLIKDIPLLKIPSVINNDKLLRVVLHKKVTP